MADYSNILDAIRGGEDISGINLDELLAQPPQSQSNILPVSTPGNSQQGETTISSSVGRRPNTDITSILSEGKSNGGSGPSQNLSDANAFIRKNRDGNGNQVAALLQPQGGADAVNKNTDSYGVRAEVGPNGEITLTNVGVNPKAPVYPTSPSGAVGTGFVAPNTPTSIQSLLNSLQKADDVDTARGIAASLRNASAIETSKYENQAVQFSENQLGVPKLQKDLQSAMAADLADPKYTPGMGDSPITRQIRSTLEDARSRALTNSKVYLNNNPDYAVLQASMKSADAEVARITRLGDRKDLIADQTEAERKREQNRRDFQAQDFASTLDADSKQRVLMLNPELQSMTPDDQAIQMGKIVMARGKADKNYAAAIQTPAAQLPVLAVAGNPYANKLVVSKEAAATGDSEDVIQSRLNNMQKIALNPNFDKSVKQFFGDTKEGKAQYQAYVDTVNNNKLDATGKGQRNEVKFQMALAMEKKRTTVNFQQNLNSWKVDTDTKMKADMLWPTTTTSLGASALFEDSVAQTQKITGKTDMLGVLNQFLGDSTGTDRVQKSKAFNQIMYNTALQKKDSMFGAPDARALTSQINSETTKSMMGRWMDSVRRTNAEKVATRKAAGQGGVPFSSSGVAEGDLFGFADEAPVDYQPGSDLTVNPQ